MLINRLLQHIVIAYNAIATPHNTIAARYIGIATLHKTIAMQHNAIVSAHNAIVTRYIAIVSAYNAIATRYIAIAEGRLSKLTRPQHVIDETTLWFAFHPVFPPACFWSSRLCLYGNVDRRCPTALRCLSTCQSSDGCQSHFSHWHRVTGRNGFGQRYGDRP